MTFRLNEANDEPFLPVTRANTRKTDGKKDEMSTYLDLDDVVADNMEAKKELAALRAGYARLESENEELFGAVAGVLADAEHKGYTTKGTKELCHHAAKNWIAARKDLKK